MDDESPWPRLAPIGAGRAHPPLRRTSRPADSLFLESTENPSTLTVAPPGDKSELRGQDSCYSSCSEESCSQHAAVSRAASDSLGTILDAVHIEEPSSFPEENELASFATKLGYSPEQFRVAVAKFAGPPTQDELLTELVKNGRAAALPLSQPLNLHSQQQNSASAAATPTPQNAPQPPPPLLRSVVIDGSNVAMTHGRKEVFSCVGIRSCVDFFRRRGHTDILVFVPQFRKEAPRADCPILDQHVLAELEQQRVLVWTPSRRINGRRVVCHDDRYILKTAEEKDAVIVSNDAYRDLARDQPSYRRLVDTRLLMYSFVDGKFMPPDDPLGRHGPTLDQFLSTAPFSVSALLCPYARKCTYGNKCKYFHPERAGGQHVGVAERLQRALSAQNSFSCSTSSTSATGEQQQLLMMQQHQQAPQQRKHALFRQSNLLGDEFAARAPVARSQSLTVPGWPPPPPSSFPHHHQHPPPPPPPPLPAAAYYHPNPAAAAAAAVGALPHQPYVFHQHSQLAPPPPVWFQHRQQQQQQQQQPSPAPQHAVVSRHASAPPSSAVSALFSPHLFAPSTAVWGASELSVGPFSAQDNGAATSSSSSTASTLSSSVSLSTSDECEARASARFHLAAIFPPSAVAAVMAAHPQEKDAQKLCELLVAGQKAFAPN